MRSSTLLTAAFAGVALSSPLVKRDLVLDIDTVVDVVYVTEYLTETAGAATATSEAEVTSAVAPTTSTLVASSSTPVAKSFYENDYSWSSAWTSTYAASSVVASSVSVATSSSSVYVAPSSSETSATSSATSSAAETTSVAKTTSAASAKATTYQEIVIAHHNVHRANHSASDVTWSDSLASTAASIAANCVYNHNVTANGGGYGQNIAAGVPASNVSFVISDLFYNGEVNHFNGLYGQANPSMADFENWGHFSQIVWKATSQVGCATHDCSATGLANTGDYVSPYFTVCNYYTPGNYGGEYGTEIGKPLGDATANWSYGL